MHVLTNSYPYGEGQAERAPTLAGTLEKCAGQQAVRYLVNAYSGPGAVAHSPDIPAASNPAVRMAYQMCVCLLHWVEVLWSGTKRVPGNLPGPLQRSAEARPGSRSAPAGTAARPHPAGGAEEPAPVEER